MNSITSILDLKYKLIIGIVLLLFIIFAISSIVKTFNFIDDNYSDDAQTQYAELKGQMNRILTLSFIGTIIFTVISLLYEYKKETGPIFVSVVSNVECGCSISGIKYIIILYINYFNIFNYIF